MRVAPVEVRGAVEHAGQLAEHSAALQLCERPRRTCHLAATGRSQHIGGGPSRKHTATRRRQVELRRPCQVNQRLFRTDSHRDPHDAFGARGS